MNKRTFITTTALSTLLASCSQLELNEGGSNEHRFSFVPSLVTETANRAIDGTHSFGGKTYLAHNDFAVFASGTEQDDFESCPSPSTWMYYTKIASNSGAWTHTTDGEHENEYYFDIWDTNGMHSFFAFSPYQAAMDANISTAKGEAPAMNYAINPTDITAGYDLMYASAMNIEGNKYPDHYPQGNPFPANGCVTMHFRHALTQILVTFKVKNAEEFFASYPDEQATINSVGLSAMQTDGTLSFNPNGTAKWTLYDPTAAYEWAATNDNVLMARNAKTGAKPFPTTDGHVALVMPQLLPNNTTLNFRYTYNGVSTDNSIAINNVPYQSIPLTKFEMGKRYHFIVEFMPTGGERPKLKTLIVENWKAYNGAINGTLEQ